MPEEAPESLEFDRFDVIVGKRDINHAGEGILGIEIRDSGGSTGGMAGDGEPHHGTLELVAIEKILRWQIGFLRPGVDPDGIAKKGC